MGKYFTIDKTHGKTEHNIKIIDIKYFWAAALQTVDIRPSTVKRVDSHTSTVCTCHCGTKWPDNHQLYAHATPGRFLFHLPKGRTP